MADYTIRDDLKYSEEHEWVRVEGEIAIVGITDYAQSELTDIVYVDLPEVGTRVKQMNPFGTIEAVKTVSDLYSPISGEVVEVNEKLKDDPGLVNRDPYGEGWMIKIRIEDPQELNSLLSPEEYKKKIGE